MVLAGRLGHKVKPELMHTTRAGVLCANVLLKSFIPSCSMCLYSETAKAEISHRASDRLETAKEIPTSGPMLSLESQDLLWRVFAAPSPL